MQFLSVSDVVDLQKILINQFGGIHGIRDKGLLESAIEHPKLCYSLNLERDVYALSALYGFHLIHKHAFVDGNKRIGILAMLTFLKVNDIKVRISKDELYSLGMKIATSAIKENEIAHILQSHSLAMQS